MSQQGLNRADVCTTLEQVGGKGMAKRMNADTLGQPSAPHSYHNPQPASVQKLRNQLGSSFQQRDDGSNLIARTHTVEADKTHYPVQIGALGVNRVVMEAQILADLIE